MKFNIEKLDKKKIYKNFPQILNPSISFKLFKEVAFYPILLSINKDKYIPIIFFNDIDDYPDSDIFLIFDYEENIIEQLKNNLFQNRKDPLDITCLLIELIENEKENENKSENESFNENENKIKEHKGKDSNISNLSYTILSILFLMLFYKPVFNSNPAFVIYIMKKLYFYLPDKIMSWKYYDTFSFLISKENFFSFDFLKHLIFIDADKSLLLEINNFFEKNISFNRMEMLVRQIINCQLNKNRIRKLIEQLYRITDLNKFDFFILKLKESENFFNDKKISSNQKELRLSNIINSIINPSYTEKYLRFNKLINNLNFKNLVIKPSFYFEKNEYSISATIKNQDELLQFNREIEILKDNNDKIIDFLWKD